MLSLSEDVFSYLLDHVVALDEEEMPGSPIPPSMSAPFYPSRPLDLPWGSTPSLASLALISKRTRELVNPVLFRRLRIQIQGSGRVIRSLRVSLGTPMTVNMDLPPSNILSFVRHLDLVLRTNFPGDRSGDAASESSILQLLALTPSLRTISLNEDMYEHISQSPTLVDAMQARSSLHSAFFPKALNNGPIENLSRFGPLNQFVCTTAISLQQQDETSISWEGVCSWIALGAVTHLTLNCDVAIIADLPSMSIPALRCLELEYTNPFVSSDQWISFVDRHYNLNEMRVARRRCEYGEGQDALDKIPWIQTASEEHVLSNAMRILGVRMRRTVGCSFLCVDMMLELSPNEPETADSPWVARVIRKVGEAFGALERLTVKCHDIFHLPKDSRGLTEFVSGSFANVGFQNLRFLMMLGCDSAPPGMMRYGKFCSFLSDPLFDALPRLQHLIMSSNPRRNLGRLVSVEKVVKRTEWKTFTIENRREQDAGTTMFMRRRGPALHDEDLDLTERDVIRDEET